MASSSSSSSSISSHSFHSTQSLSIGVSSSAEALEGGSSSFQFVVTVFQSVMQSSIDSAAEDGEVLEPLAQDRIELLASNFLQHIREKYQILPDQENGVEELGKLTKVLIDDPNEPEAMSNVTWMKVDLIWVMMFCHEEMYIAEGGESNVYRGILENGVLCAVKVMKNEKEEEEVARRRRVFDEICDSPYLVHHYGSTEWYMLEELC